MSIRLMTLVWNNFCRGGSEKLVMLKLADWANDEGGSLHPSIRAIATKSCVSESQARRIVHGFIDAGLLEVVGNSSGGAPGATRHYRIRVDRLEAMTPSAHATPRTDATPSADARPRIDARDASHGCAQTASTGARQTVMDPSKNRQVGAHALTKSKAKSKTLDATPITMRAFFERCKAANEEPIPEGDAVFSYAAKAKIPHEFVALAWKVFRAKYIDNAKRYPDWRAAFKGYVEQAGYGLWTVSAASNQYELTGKGRQARKAFAK
jgi:hypothetical protein